MCTVDRGLTVFRNLNKKYILCANVCIYNQDVEYVEYVEYSDSQCSQDSQSIQCIQDSQSSQCNLSTRYYKVPQPTNYDLYHYNKLKKQMKC